jgi:mRNA-degrading endonuclease toxin of MazEF toxin-antitoxin module
VTRGEIYVVDLGAGQGREPSGVSPVVIVSNDLNNQIPFFVAVLPAVGATDALARLGLPVPASLSGYPIDISVLWHQPRTLDASRFTSGPVGEVPANLMLRINFELQVFLDLQNVPVPPP